MISTSSHFFYLAPIRGITDATFRRIFHRHFPYFDAAIAPFINPQRFAGLNKKFLIDVLPENNSALPIIPQLIYNNSEDFLHLGQCLEQMGYTHINWNLGCPAPTVTNKKRGSGLLPYRETILKLLDEVIPKLKASLSIKTRLGFQSSEELKLLLPDLEAYPLQELIIHPRLGKQLYRGNVDLETFSQCLALTNHRLVYNGDICTATDFTALSHRFPTIDRWMLGRGALANPFLVAEIRGLDITRSDRLATLRAFHEEIYEDLQHRLNGPSHILSRAKQIWNYLAESFPESPKLRKKIQRTSSLGNYREFVEQLFLKAEEKGD